LRRSERRASRVSADDANERRSGCDLDRVRRARREAPAYRCFADRDPLARRLRGRRGEQSKTSRYRADRTRQSSKDQLLMTARRIGFTGEGLRRAAPPRRTQKGVGLLEVLIAVVIVAIGLLGLAGLQTVSLQLNQGALVRSQASNLAYDITERIRANWADAAAYSIGLDDDPEASPSTLAAADVKEWRDALAATLPDGTGSVNVAG